MQCGAQGRLGRVGTDQGQGQGAGRDGRQSRTAGRMRVRPSGGSVREQGEDGVGGTDAVQVAMVNTQGDPKLFRAVFPCDQVDAQGMRGLWKRLCQQPPAEGRDVVPRRELMVVDMDFGAGRRCAGGPCAVRGRGGSVLERRDGSDPLAHASGQALQSRGGCNDMGLSGSLAAARFSVGSRRFSRAAGPRQAVETPEAIRPAVSPPAPAPPRGQGSRHHRAGDTAPGPSGPPSERSPHRP